MFKFRLFYDNNEDKYRVLPELITAGLACASCFEDSQQWHRAKVINVVDEHNVKVNTVFRIYFIMDSPINIK